MKGNNEEHNEGGAAARFYFKLLSLNLLNVPAVPPLRYVIARHLITT